MTTFSDFLERTAQAGGGRLAVAADDTTMTYGDLDERSSRLANALLALGVRTGDRVADIQPNSARAVETIFGLARSGAVRVPVNARLIENDAIAQIADADPVVVILGVGLEHLAAPLLATPLVPGSSLRAVLCHRPPSAPPPGCHNYEQALAAAGSSRPDVQVGWDDVCAIRYTGGTTGRPKGVVLPHRSEVLYAMNILLDTCPIQPDDVFLHLQPLSHGGGGFIPPAVLRGAVNIVESTFDPARVLQLIEERGVTLVKLVPTMLLRLLDHPDLDRRDLSSLRRIVYGASPMPLAPLRRAVERLGPVLAQGYGQTEAPMTITYLGPEDHDLDANPKALHRLASAGRPVTSVRIRIEDPDGNALGPDELGEIVVQSPHQMTGYWRNPAATAETLVNGWVRTGDIGRLDADGYLFIVDRKGDVVITGGYNVYPREVEDVLYTHPAVAEAAVFGVPHPDWVEAVTAAVVLRHGSTATAAEIAAYCAERLTAYKRPKTVRVLDALPRSSAGKIVRREVRQRVLDAQPVAGELSGTPR